MKSWFALHRMHSRTVETTPLPVASPPDLNYNALILQYNGNFTIAAGTYPASQTISGTNYHYLRLFAYDNMTEILQAFPKFNNVDNGYILGSIVCEYVSLNDNATSASTSLLLIKQEDRIYACCGVCRSDTESGTIHTRQTSISIRVGTAGASCRATSEQTFS